MPATPFLAIDAPFAAVLISLELAALAVAAWLVADRIQLEHRLTRIEGTMAEHDKVYGAWSRIQGRRRRGRKPAKDEARGSR